MSRSGYSDECENVWLYRHSVKRAIQGKRGQAFLQELATAMDAMPAKRLISDQLEADGEFCALGVVGHARGLDMKPLDYECPRAIGNAFGIARSMAAEIEFMNDDWGYKAETPEERWTRMRAWVQHIIDGGDPQ